MCKELQKAPSPRSIISPSVANRTSCAQDSVSCEEKKKVAPCTMLQPPPGSSSETPSSPTMPALPTPSCLPHQALPSSMKSTVNMPRSNGNNLGAIPEKVPGGSSRAIYSHHLPSGIPLGSQKHKLQTQQAESSLSRSPERVQTVCVCIPAAAGPSPRHCVRSAVAH